MKKALITLGFVFVAGWALYFLLGKTADTEIAAGTEEGKANVKEQTSKVEPAPVPPQKILANDYHIFQTFNNCAPVALSMGLSYYGVRVSQEELAAALRPTNNLTGNNDDKSTPPDELGEKAKEYGLIPYFRASGSIDIIKQLIAQDLPIIVRTLLHADEDYAHYRVIKGYDAVKQEIIQDDGFEGKNLRFSYDKFLTLWQPFNYAYLVLVPPDKKEVVEAILGEELDAKKAWENAAQTAQYELEADPNDKNAALNLAVANYYLGDYEGSAEAFEKVETRLTTHTIWYQIEPIHAYFELGNYARVFALADGIIGNGNKAFTELYLLRGYSYLKQGRKDFAKVEFEKAVLYNKNSQAAKEALASVQ